LGQTGDYYRIFTFFAGECFLKTLILTGKEIIGVRSLNKILGLVVVGLLIAGGVAAFGRGLQNGPDEVGLPGINGEAVAGWNVYTDEADGFSLGYPPDWTMASREILVDRVRVDFFGPG
jgi:hypothetical protein